MLDENAMRKLHRLFSVTWEEHCMNSPGGPWANLVENQKFFVEKIGRLGKIGGYVRDLPWDERESLETKGYHKDKIAIVCGMYAVIPDETILRMLVLGTIP